MPNKHENLRERSKVKPQGEDAAFLVEEFEMPENDAAELVAREGVDAGKVADEARKIERRRDPLADVPTPEEPAVISNDADEQRLKPVVHAKNQRASGG